MTKKATESRTLEESRDSVALRVLLYEFSAYDKAEDNDRKIKSRLRYRNKQPLSPERVALLRQFKDELQAEVHKFNRSKYYRKRTGYYADVEDFDHPRLAADLSARYPQISKSLVRRVVPFAIFCYYVL